MASFVVDNGDSILGGNAIISNASTVYDNVKIGGQISLLNTYAISFIGNTYNNTSCINLSTSLTGKYVTFCSLNKIYSSSDFGTRWHYHQIVIQCHVFPWIKRENIK